MEYFFFFVGIYFMPVLAIIFCLNLVGIIKKVKHDESTKGNTFWMTTSFIFIVWTISILSMYNS